jgi:hypothetical protein
MSECSAQTKVSPPGLTAQNELQTTLRGLELIKSSAKFYANGAGVAKPTVKLPLRWDAAFEWACGQTNVPFTRPQQTEHKHCTVWPISLALAAIV